MKKGLKAIALVSGCAVIIGVVTLSVLCSLERIVDHIEIMLETTSHGYGAEDFDDEEQQVDKRADLKCGCGCDVGE